ncbi:MAG: DUF5996 family protein [Rhodospirillales bacterium]
MQPWSFPPLPYTDWADSKETLHLFLQIVGKVRLKTHPKLNHWWHVTLYPHTRGLTTGRIPYGGGAFDILVDLLEHRMVISASDGRRESFKMGGQTVAGFHTALFQSLQALDVEVVIYPLPYEHKSKLPFPEDQAARLYDKEAVGRYWQALSQIASVFEIYRGRFMGKQTPVQLFWHSFDLAVTRFSGKPCPLEGGTPSDREAYSHEVISVGFWPGDDSFQEAAFYGYAYPEPTGLAERTLEPAQALWAEKNGGALAVYRYEDLRLAADPEAALLSFLESLYQGAGEAAAWPLDNLRHDK